MQEILRNLFTGLTLELFVVVASLLLRDDRRKVAVVLLLGTLGAGAIVFHSEISKSIPPGATPTAQFELPTSVPTVGEAVVASLPTQQDLLRTRSIWELVSYKNLERPGTETYNITVQSGDEWRWGFSWCAMDYSRLQQILKPLSVDFMVNGMRIANHQVLQYETTATNGWQCHYWSTVLSNWQRGVSIQLGIVYNLSDSIYDGKDSYPLGLYSQIVIARVD